MFGVAEGDDSDFVGLYLKDGFDGAFEGVLEGDDAFGFEAEGCDGLDVERVGDVGSEELDEVELFAKVGAGLRHGTAPVAGGKSRGKPSARCERHFELTW